MLSWRLPRAGLNKLVGTDRLTFSSPSWDTEEGVVREQEVLLSFSWLLGGCHTGTRGAVMTATRVPGSVLKASGTIALEPPSNAAAQGPVVIPSQTRKEGHKIQPRWVR